MRDARRGMSIDEPERPTKILQSDCLSLPLPLQNRGATMLGFRYVFQFSATRKRCGNRGELAFEYFHYVCLDLKYAFSSLAT